MGLPYLQDPPRVILIVCNAPVAHPPLGNDGRIQSAVRARTSRAAWLASIDESADSGLSLVLFLNLMTAFCSQVKPDSTCNSCNSNDTDNDACGDAGCTGSRGATP